LTNQRGVHLQRADKRDAWKLLQRRKCHLDKGLDSKLPAEVYRALKSMWEPVVLYSNMLSILPAPLVRLWAEAAGGYLLFTSERSRYIPHGFQLGRMHVASVALVNIHFYIFLAINPHNSYILISHSFIFAEVRRCESI
jgi:hypothetical protein